MKYEILKDEFIELDGRKLYQIKALKDFRDVKEGEFGGYIESERNLSHEGDAWVYGSAWVSGDAQVYGNNAVVCFSNVGTENGTLTVYCGKKRADSHTRLFHRQRGRVFSQIRRSTRRKN